MLLFDEIWFLSKRLCPYNMQALPYVRFLEEEGRIPTLHDTSLTMIRDQLREHAGYLPHFSFLLQLSEHYYSEALKNIPSEGTYLGPWRELDTEKLPPFASSLEFENLVVDLLLLHRLNDRRLELVTNSATNVWLRSGGSLFRTSLAHLLTIDEIPNFLTPDGPYHPCIEDLRKNRFLCDFRKWVSEQSGAVHPSVAEKVSAEVKQVIRQAEDRIFLKCFDPATLYRATALTAVGTVTDLLLPPTGTVVSFLWKILKYKRLQNRRWQAFLVSAWRRSASRGRQA